MTPEQTQEIVDGIEAFVESIYYDLNEESSGTNIHRKAMDRQLHRMITELTSTMINIKG